MINLQQQLIDILEITSTGYQDDELLGKLVTKKCHDLDIVAENGSTKMTEMTMIERLEYAFLATSTFQKWVIKVPPSPSGRKLVEC